MVSSQDKSEIVFFDLETTIPARPGQKHAILEFGSILVCPKTLMELDNYSTLVQPSDISLISAMSVRCNGISREDVVSAPSFAQIADRVFDILDGRIWAGHNINRFDCPRLRDAFQEINRPPPQPKGTIDSLTLLTQRFGRRAGDMKMASLATYFGLGAQSHRSLDDVRMNLEVLKYCATVLFLESSLPDVFTANSWVSPNAITRNRGNQKSSPEGTGLNNSTPSSSSLIKDQPISTPQNNTLDNHPILSLMTPGLGDCELNLAETCSAPAPDPFNMSPLSNLVEEGRIQPDDTIMESISESLNLSTANSSDAFRDRGDFLKPNNISVPSITVVLSPAFQGLHKLQILHNNSVLHVCCEHMKVRFGLSTKFVDYAGQPRLSFVLDASSDLCQVLDACDNLAHKMSLDSGSSSDWRPVVTRKAGFVNSPTIRLHLPTVWDGNSAKLSTEIYQKESSSTQKVVFSRYDVAELDALLAPGTFMDVYFSLDPYDYQQNAGIRLVAKKLVVHSS
ncbi:protein NEN1-like [Apium graveolens]|uniref:protein NEN1-like n=1 Tax=Apium graveolens TaxID=4045 RepID=UPI003D790DF7